MLLTDRELPDAGPGIDPEFELLAEFGDATLDCGHVEPDAFAGLRCTEGDVLGHGEGRDEAEMLMHHADAGIDGIARGVEGDTHPAHLEMTGVGSVQPGEDVGERGLAGAVLAEERMHLADAHIEVHVVIGDDTGEPLGDAEGGHRRSGDRLRVDVCRHCSAGNDQPFGLPSIPFTK